MKVYRKIKLIEQLENWRQMTNNKITGMTKGIYTVQIIKFTTQRMEKLRQRKFVSNLEKF